MAQIISVSSFWPLNWWLGYHLQIERRAADSLSWDEFMHRYAQKSVPVIITGLVHKMTTKPWTLNHIREKAGMLN